MRLTNKWVLGALATAALAVLLSPASPVLGGEGSTPTFSIGDGEGPAGGDAGVTLSLSGDDGAAVSAGVDIEFNDTDLTFTTPVSSSCTLDERIASTHQVAGRIIEPGVVNIEILVAGTPDPLPPLGNGALAVCNFTIRGDANEGDMFPLAATNVFIGDATGGEIPSNSEDGVITVVSGTPTATPTATGGTPTATETATEGTPVVDTPTATATATATGDDVSTPTPTTSPGDVTYSLSVDPSSQTGVPGGTVSVSVVLASDPSDQAADTVANEIGAEEGLEVSGCEAAEGIEAEFEALEGGTTSATLGGDSDVPTGTVYTCDVAIAEDATGTLEVRCANATANGAAITCSGASVVLPEPPTATPTEEPTVPTATPTNTRTPTEVPTNTPSRSSDDDGCAVGPVADSSNPMTSILFLLVPAALLWRRRR